MLEQRFTELASLHQMSVVAVQSAAYFVPAVLSFLIEAWSFRVGEQAGLLLLRHAPYLYIDSLKAALATWASNSPCREAAWMPKLADTPRQDPSALPWRLSRPRPRPRRPNN